MRDPKEYYDAIGEDEWHRLVKSPYRRLEFEITMHFLREYLPKEGMILDAGGGPGRYAIELAKMGYEVVLTDISPTQLEIAKEKIEGTDPQVKGRITNIMEGTITNLSELDDESFDSVLCLGAMSHLIQQSDREKAATELVRVLEHGSPIFVSVIGRYAAFRVILRDLPGELADPGHLAMFNNGVHHGHEIVRNDKDFKKTTSFPDAYFFVPEEMPRLFEKQGIETLELASCEGLSAHLNEATNSLYEDKEKWKKWFEILLRTCTDPSIIGIGEHILYVGRKR